MLSHVHTLLFFFFFYVSATPRDLHYPLRRQRQMCIRDSLDTIQLEMNQAALRVQTEAGPRRLILAPGNYGLDYLGTAYPEFVSIPVVKTSNFIGDTLDMAASAGFEDCLLYTSDAADEEDSGDFGGRGIIKKKKRDQERRAKKKKEEHVG